MSLILSGTDGLSDVDGSAATPAIRGTDANTGMFFPAADTIAFSEGGVESMRIDSSGNVGIGTSSPAATLNVSTVSSNATLLQEVVRLATTGRSGAGGTNNRGTLLSFSDASNPTLTAAVGGIRQSPDADFNGALGFYTNNTGGSPASSVSQLTERMRIDSSGQVIVGPFGGGGNAVVAGSSSPSFTNQPGTNLLLKSGDGSGTGSSFMSFSTSPAGLSGTTVNTAVERMRITSTGLALFNSTSSTFSMPTTGGASFKGDNTGGGSPIVEVGNTNTTSGSDGSPAFLVFKSSATTSSSARFIQFSASGTGQQMGAIVGNGAGLCQFVNLSDAREKTNIAPLTNALARITALKPSTFNMISTNEHIAGGFIAQEVIKVFPEYVVENIANKGAEQRYGLTGGMTGGYIAVLTAAIQELKAELDSVKAELQTLKGN